MMTEVIRVTLLFYLGLGLALTGNRARTCSCGVVCV